MRLLSDRLTPERRQRLFLAFGTRPYLVSRGVVERRFRLSARWQPHHVRRGAQGFFGTWRIHDAREKGLRVLKLRATRRWQFGEQSEGERVASRPEIRRQFERGKATGRSG